MNELDQLIRFRDEVPLAVTPRAERLFRAGLQENHYPERIVASRPRNPLTRIWTPWRLGIVAFVAAALVAGILVAVLPGGGTVQQSGTAVLTVRMLADRASAAALAQPAVSPGQWVYRVAEGKFPNPPKGMPSVHTEAGWETADGLETYGSNPSAGVSPGAYIPSYSQLGSLPRDPRALDAYLAHRVYPNSKPAADIMGMSAFSNIDQMLSNYVLPPALAAEMYQALAVIPGVQVDSHVTAIDGQAGVAFVLPATPQSVKQEIILDASNYRYLAHGAWFSDSSFSEQAIVRMTIVGAPGSTRPSLTPPTAAELLAEQADRAVSYSNGPPQVIKPGTWIMRKLATSSGDQTVWATADDSEQASYTGGKLQVCSRTAACAKSTQWLMPAGPSYGLVNPPLPKGRPPFKHRPPTLPDSLPQLLTTLNTYRTGCADVAGDCNAVNAMTNILAGYGSQLGPQGSWFLMLADIPGVTVRQVTDVTGQRDVALHFPFGDGVTDILFSTSNHEFAGYVRDGAETVITKQVTVSGPGSTTPVVSRPKYAPLPKG